MADTTLDGQPFGIARTATTFHRLVLNPTGATLFAVTQDGEEELVWVDSQQWSKVAAVALDDFNGRLEAKYFACGSWPDEAGFSVLHPSFGRELQLLMEFATDCRVSLPAHIRRWKDCDGRERFAVWTRWQSTKIAVAHWFSERTQSLIWVMAEHLRNRHRVSTADAHERQVAAAEAEKEAHFRAMRAYLLDDDSGPLERFAAERRTSEESAQLERLVANRYVTMRRGVASIESDDAYSWRMHMRREAVAAARQRDAEMADLTEAA